MHAPFVLIPQFFGSLVFYRSDARYFPFDRDSTGLLRQLATRRIDQVLTQETLCESKRDAIHHFYEFFEPRGWFTPNGRFAADMLDIEPPADHLARHAR